jgi:hypothetical protein
VLSHHCVPEPTPTRFPDLIGLGLRLRSPKRGKFSVGAFPHSYRVIDRPSPEKVTTTQSDHHSVQGPRDTVRPSL